VSGVPSALEPAHSDEASDGSNRAYSASAVLKIGTSRISAARDRRLDGGFLPGVHDDFHHARALEFFPRPREVGM